MLEKEQALAKNEALETLCRSQKRRIMELEELLALAKGYGGWPANAGNGKESNCLTVPMGAQVDLARGQEVDPAKIIGELTHENTELK